MSRTLALVATLVGLAACQAVPTRPLLGPDPAARAALLSLSAWHATGRVAVRAGGEGFSASFDWLEAGGHGELGVHGPFGAGAVRIMRSADRILIESGNRPPLEVAAPFEALEPELTARLGFPLPLDPLRYWVLGIPAPGLPVDGAGSDFRQGGWHVAVSEFVPVAGAPGPLPARLVLRRAATRIRVVVDRWQVGS